jgi:DNA-directed RNA polymerase subunit H (RpoH/RPB5)
MDYNSTISKINKSRYILKKYLESDWDISVIKDYSDDEIENLYNISKPDSNGINFGNASSCNITLYHNKIRSHKLHIIYYNFPELGKPSVKITKTCSEKIHKLYSDEIIDKDDSIIIILYNPIPENLIKSIEDLYIKNQEELISSGLSEQVNKENKLLKIEDKLNLVHFRNIHIFHLDELTIDILLHSKVPEHIIIRNEIEINKILQETNSTINQLPIVLRTDAIAKRFRLAPGDVFLIKRITRNAGEIKYYRACK